MIFRRVVLACAAGLAAVFVTAAAASATPATAVYGAGGRIGWHHPVVRPWEFIFGAGGDLYVTNLNWRTWKVSTSTAAARVHINSCVPDCAAGNVYTRAATLALSDVLSHDGQPYFARMVLRWVNHKDVFLWSRPQGAKIFAWNQTVGCHPLTNGGNCYEPGEFCRNDDHHLAGVAGDGKAITCENADGWRWEPS